MTPKYITTNLQIYFSTNACFYAEFYYLFEDNVELRVCSKTELCKLNLTVVWEFVFVINNFNLTFVIMWK